MKRIILNIIMLTVVIAGHCEGNTWLQLQMHSGATMSFIVPGSLRLTVKDNDFNISSPRMNTTLRADLVKQYSFHNDSDIDTSAPVVEGSEVRIRYVNPDEVLITGVAMSQEVKVYSTNGTELSPRITRSSDAIRVSLASLPPGILLVTLPGVDVQSMKIVH